jgi:LysR family transcriptional regulator for bpeEF and oprC
MQGLQPLIAFADTARHGGFAAAARETGVAPSTLAKSVARLEHSLGVRLFHRTTRQVRLTPDGERLYQRCQRVLLELAELQAEASGSAAAPAGLLRIDMPVYYGRHFVMPILARLQARYPQLVLDLRLADGFTDLVRDRIDVAVRIARLSDSTLVARRIGWQHLVLCASADYLARLGTPRRLEDLAAHDAIVFRLPSSGRDRPWQFRQRGADVDVQPRPRVRVSETDGLLEALLLGMGICQVPDYLVAGPIARGRLVELLPSYKAPPLPINIVHPPGRMLPARVRAAIEALETLRARRDG